MTPAHAVLNIITLAVMLLLAALLTAARIAARNYENDRDRELDDDDWLDWWGK